MAISYVQPDKEANAKAIPIDLVGERTARRATGTAAPDKPWETDGTAMAMAMRLSHEAASSSTWGRLGPPRRADHPRLSVGGLLAQSIEVAFRGVKSGKTRRPFAPAPPALQNSRFANSNTERAGGLPLRLATLSCFATSTPHPRCPLGHSQLPSPNSQRSWSFPFGMTPRPRARTCRTALFSFLPCPRVPIPHPHPRAAAA